MRKILSGLFWGIVLTILFLSPVWRNINDHMGSRQDGPLVAWLINWGSQAFIGGENIFSAPFFYPYQNTLAYSDQFISTALLNIPLYLLSDNLIINHNLHLLVGSVVIFLGQYLLAQKLFKDNILAIISGVIFTFTHMHLDFIAHLHVFLLAGIPFYFLFLFNFLEKGRVRDLVLCQVAFLYQALNSIMSGYFLIVVSSPLLLNKTVRQKIWQERKVIWPTLAGTLIWLAFFFHSYWLFNLQFQVVRSIREAAHIAFSLNKFLSPEIMFLFFGSALLGWRQRRLPNLPQKKTDYTLFFALVAIIGSTLMLGPVLKINDQTFKIFGWPIPLPYTVLYYLLPGFKAFRASSRWIVILAFGLALLFPALMKKNQLTTINKTIILAILTSFLLIQSRQQIKLFAIPQSTPAIYQIIKARPETSLAEFPVYVWSDFADYPKEADRLLYQAYHGKKLFNGLSGFAPPEREITSASISDTITAEETLNYLRLAKVELVLLHGAEKSEYENLSSPSLIKIACLEKDCLYHLK